MKSNLLEKSLIVGNILNKWKKMDCVVIGVAVAKVGCFARLVELMDETQSILSLFLRRLPISDCSAGPSPLKSILRAQYFHTPLVQ